MRVVWILITSGAMAWGQRPPQKLARTPSAHVVALGAARRVPYTPADVTPDEKNEDTVSLKVRPLIVDDLQRDWTMGEMHEVTDRTFAIRRILHVNDALANEKSERWVWEPGPWLLVDRMTGRITVVKLPEFDAEVSNVAWYRDYGAYCGIATTAKGGLFAMVAQLGARKAVAQKLIGGWPQVNHFVPVCQAAVWERRPMRVTLKPTGGEAVTVEVVGSVGLVEEDTE